MSKHKSTNAHTSTLADLDRRMTLLEATTGNLLATVEDTNASVRAVVELLATREGAIQAEVAIQAPVVQGEVIKGSRKGKAAKGKKAKAIEAPATKASKALTRSTLAEFRKAHKWATKLSVYQASQAVLTGEQELAAGWRLATTRLAKAAGVTVADYVAQRDDDDDIVVVVAEVVADEPAKKVDERPRRANGTIAPKGEWVVRRHLEAQGLSRAQVDKKTAKAMKVLA